MYNKLELANKKSQFNASDIILLRSIANKIAQSTNFYIN